MLLFPHLVISSATRHPKPVTPVDRPSGIGGWDSSRPFGMTNFTPVIPAKAGIHSAGLCKKMDPRFHGHGSSPFPRAWVIPVETDMTREGVAPRPRRHPFSPFLALPYHFECNEKSRTRGSY